SACLNFLTRRGPGDSVGRPSDKNLTLVNAPELDRYSNAKCSAVKADIANVYAKYLDDEGIPFRRMGGVIVDSMVRARIPSSVVSVFLVGVGPVDTSIAAVFSVAHTGTSSLLRLCFAFLSEGNVSGAADGLARS